VEWLTMKALSWRPSITKKKKDFFSHANMRGLSVNAPMQHRVLGLINYVYYEHKKGCEHVCQVSCFLGGIFWRSTGCESFKSFYTDFWNKTNLTKWKNF
jgi:hypothetical protein